MMPKVTPEAMAGGYIMVLTAKLHIRDYGVSNE
jgi:hypothetical protein